MLEEHGLFDGFRLIGVKREPFFDFLLENLEKSRLFNFLFSRHLEIEKRIYGMNFRSWTHFSALLMRFFGYFGDFSANQAKFRISAWKSCKKSNFIFGLHQPFLPSKTRFLSKCELSNSFCHVLEPYFHPFLPLFSSTTKKGLNIRKITWWLHETLFGSEKPFLRRFRYVAV